MEISLVSHDNPSNSKQGNYNLFEEEDSPFKGLSNPSYSSLEKINLFIQE